MRRSLKEKKDQIAKAKKIDSAKLVATYGPLFDGLRTDSIVPLFNSVILMLRRCTLLYMAMFVSQEQWLQVILFMTMNVGASAFLLSTKIFEDNAMNYLSVFNEMIILSISYLIMQTNDLKHEPEQREIIGRIVVYLIYL